MKAIYLLIIFICQSVWAAASPYGYGTTFYNQMATQTSKYLLNKAYAYLAHEELRDSALVCYSVLANRYYTSEQSIDDRRRSVSAMNDIGYMYYYYYFDYQKAFLYYKQALDLAEKEDHQGILPLIYLNLANLYRTFGDMNMRGFDTHVLSLRYYKLSFDKARAIDDWTVALVAFYGMAHYAYWTNQLDSIRREVSIVRAAPIPKDTHLLKIDRHLCAAIDAMTRRDTTAAIREITLMTRDNDAKDNPDRFDIMAYTKIADLYLHQHHAAEALAALHAADSIATRVKAKDLQVTIYELYHHYYQSIGDTAHATEYELLYYRTKSQLQDRGKLQSIAKLHFLDEINKKNLRVRELYLQRRTQGIILLVVVLALIVLASMLAIIIRNYRKLRAAYERIYHQHAEKLRLADAERTRRQRPRPSPNDVERQQIQATIDAVWADYREICSPDFSLNRLADLTGQKYWNMSRILKDIYGKNFNTLLNEYRIQEACRRMDTPSEYAQYTIEGIAQSVGFRSRSNFVSTFKKIIGIPPSDYQKIAKKAK